MSGRKYADLKETHALLSEEWHPVNNGDLRPEMVSQGSHRKVWWKCGKGHEWQAEIKSRASGIGCPICSNKQVLPGYNDLKTTNPALAEQWHPTKNKGLGPDMVTAGSNRKVWWKCARGHEWPAVVSSRAQGVGCPCCSRKRVATGENDILTMAPELTTEWHPTKNGDLTPEKVACGSNRKVWWICEKGHEWQATTKNRMKSQGCPYCSNKRVLPGDNDLKTRYPELAAQWDDEKNGGLSPDQVVYGSQKRVWWKCARGHAWKTAVVSRIQGNNCPYCSNKRILPGENDLQTLDPELAAQWHPTKNGTVTPRQISRGSNKKVWWECMWGHAWQAEVISRAMGNGCPECARIRNSSFPEKAIVYYLKDIFPDVMENANKSVLPWLGRMEIDVYIPSLHLGIEYDGPHHVLKTDQRKNELCRRNGVQLIRVRDDRLPNDPKGSVNIRHKNQRDDSLENAIGEILKNISEICSHPVSAAVNINRDRIRILCLLKRYAGNAPATGNMPEIMVEWNHEKNGALKPEGFSTGSNRKVWWKCAKGHAWQATIAARKRGSGCPYCANKKVLPGYNDLASANPVLAEQWHPVRNGSLQPTDLTPHSGKKVWWQCKEGHEWQATVDSRGRGRGCPVCYRERREKRP